MHRKTKTAFFACLAFLAVAAYGYTYMENGFIRRLTDPHKVLMQTVLELAPSWGWLDEDREKSSQSIWSRTVEWIKNSLAPLQSYWDKKAVEEQSTMEEYYPTKSELEAFYAENASRQMAAKETKQATEDTTPAETAQPENITEETEAPFQYAQGDFSSDGIPAVATPANGVIYPTESLYDYTFLMNNFYIVDASTAADASLINGETLLNKDLTMDLSGEEPKILIYHTHSQETFADSVPGEKSDTVVGLGATLKEILETKYNISVYHDTSEYDLINGVEDRNESYSVALASIEKILADHPSIKVVIDLHRDGVNDDVHLVTDVNGRQTAQIMFFNGLCRGANADASGYIQNPYLADNLAFSLQMQVKGAEKFPGFNRRIYLRNYRFNMHVRPRTLLVECGAQTNTVEEVQNAMEPLADLLYCVLSGK